MVKNPDPDQGLGKNNPNHIFESLNTTFWVKKYLNSLMPIRNLFDPGSDPGWTILNPGSGMNIPDPQNCFPLLLKGLSIFLNYVILIIDRSLYMLVDTGYL